jgi:carboxypeptidase C (cathepsin A)
MCNPSGKEHPMRRKHPHGTGSTQSAWRCRQMLAPAMAALCLLALACGATAQQTAGAPDAPGRSLAKVPISELDAVPGVDDGDDGARPAGPPSAGSQKSEAPLPAETTTRHSLTLADRTLSFTAKVGALAFEDEKGAVVAEMGYFAYLIDGAEARKRPVTFVINGGPGAASAWLHLGALGPWRLSLARSDAYPSAPAELLPNAETWLDFTDLVFIDPVGTGYSRLHGKDKAARRRFWSLKGDHNALAVFIKRWLEANGRLESPRVFAGESYGGFRGPRLAQTLQAMPGLALNGMVLISPTFGAVKPSVPGFGNAITRTASFPSLAAAIADAKGPVTAEQLKAFEREAITGYLPDMLAGPRDAAALERLAVRIAAITGLGIETVRRIGPRAWPGAFLRAVDRTSGLASSMYDATEKRIAAYDGPDQIDDGGDLSGLAFHLARAMPGLAEGRLGWKAPRAYRVLGKGVRWRWSGAESVSPLRRALVRDPTLRVLIVHGYADLVTPYFRTKLMLQQLPTIGPDNSRIRFEVYPGGHMFYSRDASRAQLRKDALALFEAIRAGR